MSDWVIRNRLLGLMFFISGFCGLLYQIVWLRLAFSSFGVITPVISVVVSVFMMGLGLGSWLGGRLASKLSEWKVVSSIVVYGLIEGIIAIGAIAVPSLFENSARSLLNWGTSDSWLYLSASAIAILVSILPWTTAMGMTYPIALAFFQEFSDFDRHRFSQLYIFNTAGATAGAVATVLYLIELFGFKKALLVAGALNASLAVLAISWGLLRGFRGIHVLLEEPSAECNERKFAPVGFKFSLLILFLTGLCSMAMEVVWVRAFSPALVHSVYAFAFILISYLAGNSVGSAIYGLTAGFKRIFSTGVLLGSAVVAVCLLLLLANGNWASNLSLIQIFQLTMILAVGCFSAILGYLTPKLIDEISRSNPEKAGRAYAINIAGCIIGPLIAGYALLPLLGTRLTLMLLVIPIVVLFANVRTSIVLKYSTLAFCTLALVVSLFSKSWEEGGSMGGGGGHQLILRDYTATVIASENAGLKKLSVNGYPMTTLSPITKLMAHLPAVLHGTPPVDVLVICLGMGTTYRSALTWGSNVTVVELVSSVRDVLPFFHPDGEKLLHDPKGKVIIDDGRRFLCRTKQKFDVIIIDPPPPSQHPVSSLLYSVQFYELLKKHLKPGGIVAQWDGGKGDEGHILQAFTRSMVRSFPYVRSYGAVDDPDKMMWGTHFLCSMYPLPHLTADEFFSRMPQGARKDLEEWFKSTDRDKEAKEMIAQLLSREKPLELLPDDNVVVTDDHPFNEYFLLREAQRSDQR